MLKKELKIYVPVEGRRQLRFNLLSVVCNIQQEQDKFPFPHWVIQSCSSFWSSGRLSAEPKGAYYLRSHLLASADSDSCNFHLEKDLAISEEIFDYLGKHQGQSSQILPMPRKPVVVAHLSKLAKISSDSSLRPVKSEDGEELPRYGMAADTATGLMLIGPEKIPKALVHLCLPRLWSEGCSWFIL